MKIQTKRLKNGHILYDRKYRAYCTYKFFDTHNKYSLEGEFLEYYQNVLLPNF